MKKRVSTLFAACAFAAGCAAGPELESDLAEPVGKLESPLFDACPADMEQDLRDNAVWAGLAADYALSVYRENPNNELALLYFGEGHNQAFVEETLLKLAMIAKGSTLVFDCQAVTHPDCANPDDALWAYNNAQLVGDRTIHVCGDRYWDPFYVNGEDSGLGASQVGVMVHEVSHLAGAHEDGVRTEQDTIAMAANPMGALITHLHADSYRFYVMKQ
jgi:hypothetical protein